MAYYFQLCLIIVIKSSQLIVPGEARSNHWIKNCQQYHESSSFCAQLHHITSINSGEENVTKLPDLTEENQAKTFITLNHASTNPNLNNYPQSQVNNDNHNQSKENVGNHNQSKENIGNHNQFKVNVSEEAYDLSKTSSNVDNVKANFFDAKKSSPIFRPPRKIGKQIAEYSFSDILRPKFPKKIKLTTPDLHDEPDYFRVPETEELQASNRRDAYLETDSVESPPNDSTDTVDEKKSFGYKVTLYKSPDEKGLCLIALNKPQNTLIN